MTETQSSTAAYLRCVAGDSTYAVDREAVVGISRSDNLQLNPGGGQTLGWLLDRRDETPVYNLAAGLHGKQALESRAKRGAILILGDEGRSWAVLVDRIERVTEAAGPLQALPALAGAAAARLFGGVVHLASGPLLCLNPIGLRSALEEPWAPSSRGAAESMGGTPANAAPDPSPAPPPLGARPGGHVVLFSAARSGDGSLPRLRFCLSVTQIPEVLETADLIRLPRAPSFVLGLTTWRGEGVPVVDLAHCLGLRAPLERSRSRLLLVGSSSPASWLGIPVDSDLEMKALPLSHRRLPPPAAARLELVRGSFEMEGEPVLVPDVDRIVRRGLHASG